MPNRSIPLSVKIQALTLTEVAGYSDRNASKVLKFAISHDQIGRLRKQATERGWNPKENPVVLEEYVIDRPRPGRPKKHNEEQDKDIVALVTKDSSSRELQSVELARMNPLNLDISASTINRILYNAGYKQRKP